MLSALEFVGWYLLVGIIVHGARKPSEQTYDGWQWPSWLHVFERIISWPVLLIADVLRSLDENREE